MFGLTKPSTQRAALRTRNPAINPNANKSICGKGGASLFISSYHDEKKHKYQQQRKERIKKLLFWATLGMVVLAVITNDEAAALLRSGTPQNEISKKSSEAIVSLPPPPPAPPAPAKPPEPAVPYCTLVSNDASVGPNVDKPVSIEKDSNDHICGRKIPMKPLMNLFEKSKKPMPALGPNVVPAGNKEVVLLKNDSPFGGMGSMLNSFFHAYDYAYEKKRPLYITQDSVLLNTLFTLFFGPLSAVEKNAKLWKIIEDTLGVKVIENEADLKLSGMTVPEYSSPNSLFWYHAQGLEASKFLDHRTAILRKLFQYPSHHGRMNVCSAIEVLLGNEKDKKYTVIHISEAGQQSWLSKLNGSTGKDHTAANEMQPTYVKNILEQLDMLKHDIYPIDSSKSVNDAVHIRLAKDPDLVSQLKCVKDEKFRHEGANIYLAVLADVYLGNPVDQMSMWVARMRFALGMTNTFILTEKRGDRWVSYMGDDNLDLYETKKLGPWMG